MGTVIRILNPINLYTLSDYSVVMTSGQHELKYENGERYILLESEGTTPTFKLQIYGDNAEPRLQDSLPTTLLFQDEKGNAVSKSFQYI